MFELEYSQAAVEVLDILEHTNKKDVEKIPLSFIKFLVNISSLNYKVNLDHSKPINELKIQEKTKEILGAIYIKWWSNEQEQQVYKQRIKKYDEMQQEELREKYNYEKIFEKRKEKILDENKQNEIVAMVKYEENIFKKIINKILSIFKK